MLSRIFKTLKNELSLYDLTLISKLISIPIKIDEDKNASAFNGRDDKIVEVTIFNKRLTMIIIRDTKIESHILFNPFVDNYEDMIRTSPDHKNLYHIEIVIIQDIVSKTIYRCMNHHSKIEFIFTKMNGWYNNHGTIMPLEMYTGCRRQYSKYSATRDLTQRRWRMKDVTVLYSVFKFGRDIVNANIEHHYLFLNSNNTDLNAYNVVEDGWLGEEQHDNNIKAVKILKQLGILQQYRDL